MTSLKLSMLAAAATLAASIGGASAMPLSTSPAAQADGLVHNARIVCNSNGMCWNTNNRSRTWRSSRHNQRRYVQPQYGYQPHYGYHQDYGYSRRGVGVGVGPVGIWVR